MATLKDIKRKIVGVKNTQQITRAMELMATAKLYRTLESLSAAQFYLDKLEQMVADLGAVCSDTSIHPLFAPRPVTSVGIVLLTGERGLCGSFNSDLLKSIDAFIAEHPAAEKKILLIGKKGLDGFQRQGFPILGHQPELLANPSPQKIQMAARNIIRFFTNDMVQELWVIYTHYVTTLERKVIRVPLLPLKKMGTERTSRHQAERPIQFDPSPQAILNSLIPRYVEGLVSRSILESSASEQAARMIAMDSATERADEMIDEMTLTLNRTRQAVITRELSEVIAGADSLAE